MKQILHVAIGALSVAWLFTSCTKTMSGSGSGGSDSTGTGSTNSSGIVSTMAGNGILGYVIGLDSASEFAGPTGVALDSKGNVYVLDAQNFVIRIIFNDSAIGPIGIGSTSTLAGNGTEGYINGLASISEFESLNGIAVDAQGNVFVSEGSGDADNRIREINIDGTVSTFAGRGKFGFVNGTGTGAAFFAPDGMAFDIQGNLYVADQYNNCIRKITPSGVVTTFAGNGRQGSVNGPADSAEFSVPTDVTVDFQGNLYVADDYNSEIRKITASGIVSTLAGTANISGIANGTGSAARFVTPIAVAVDGQGNVYETDGINNNSIRKIAPGGLVTTLAGNVDGGFMNGALLKAMFSSPSGLAVDPQGNIYVADWGNNMVRKITLH